VVLFTTELDIWPNFTKNLIHCLWVKAFLLLFVSVWRRISCPLRRTLATYPAHCCSWHLRSCRLALRTLPALTLPVNSAHCLHHCQTLHHCIHTKITKRECTIDQELAGQCRIDTWQMLHFYSQGGSTPLHKMISQLPPIKCDVKLKIRQLVHIAENFMLWFEMTEP